MAVKRAGACPCKAPPLPDMLPGHHPEAGRGDVPERSGLPYFSTPATADHSWLLLGPLMDPVPHWPFPPAWLKPVRFATYSWGRGLSVGYPEPG